LDLFRSLQVNHALGCLQVSLNLGQKHERRWFPGGVSHFEFFNPL
jgi:hypothetical protein